VDTTGLAAGTYNGTITVSSTGSSSKTLAATLTVSAPTTSSVTLTWDPNTDGDLAGYKVYRATTSGAYGAALGTVPAGTVTYQATGLSANTTYFFVITAYDDAGNESPFSNEVSKRIF
jgi:fibronectin type 3 domain-containing protein